MESLQFLVVLVLEPCDNNEILEMFLTLNWHDLQEPVKENGYVAQYMDALGTDTMVRVLHGVGMVSTLIVLVQLAGTRGLPLFVSFVTGLAIVGRLVFVNRYAFLGPGLQQLWHEAISVGGISLLPQVISCL